MTTLKRFVQMAGLPKNTRRWAEAAGQVKAGQQALAESEDAWRPGQWHPQIDRQAAEAAGLTPADFTWLDYPVSDVGLRPAARTDRYQALYYDALIPASTPQVNQYCRADERDPHLTYKEVRFGRETWWELLVTGTALQAVWFELVDVDDGTIWHRAGAGHKAGVVTAGISTDAKGRGRKIFNRLVRGPLRVRLECQPKFFPRINEKGGAELYLASTGDGHLHGKRVRGSEHVLSMSEDHHLLVDGAAPQ